jgi:hypothetical protein
MRFVVSEVLTAVFVNSFNFEGLKSCISVEVHCSFLLDSSLDYSVTLKMEVVRSSETSAKLYRITGHHIPEDNTR